MNRLAPSLFVLPLVVIAAISTIKQVVRIQVSGEPRWDYFPIDSAAHRLYISRGNRPR